jgi:hypothetical protein
VKYGWHESELPAHVCYISDLRKIHAHFPNWRIEYDLPEIIYGIVERRLTLWRAAS